MEKTSLLSDQSSVGGRHSGYSSGINSSAEVHFSVLVAKNLKLFFTNNQNRLVRQKIEVGEFERKKAQSWTFFVIVILLSFSISYVQMILYAEKYNVEWFFKFFAIAIAILVGAKLFALLLFQLFSGRILDCPCQETKVGNVYEESDKLFVCIPAYNEDEDAFRKTITSVCNSDFPKNQMHMIFIVDGNKNETYQNLLSVLNEEKFTDKVPAGQRRLYHGFYQNIGYSVFLKEENRGKRDSQWLFVEILRHTFENVCPEFVLFVDSDTEFKPDAIRHLYSKLKLDSRIAGVCGQLTLSNPIFSRKRIDRENIFYYISTLFIVGYQYYEYHFNQILSKQAESTFKCVTCLPGAFTMYRSSMLRVDEHTGSQTVLQDVEAHHSDSPPLLIEEESRSDLMKDLSILKRTDYYVMKVLQRDLILEDFFSKQTSGIIDRNLYDLGEDRTLTIRFLEREYSTYYEPRAVAMTECPDTIEKLLQQRRRWNNSTFVNLIMMLCSSTLWRQPRMWMPLFFAFFDLVGSIAVPANVVVILFFTWKEFFEWFGEASGILLNAESIITWWLILQVCVMASSSLGTSIKFFIISTFFSSLLMLVSIYHFWWFIIIQPLKTSFSWNFAIISLAFVSLHAVSSLFRPWNVLSMIFYYTMLPTVTLTIPMYSFIHLDDFSWGSR